jgi:hypothetical protein
MADTQRTDAELLASFADNNIGGITAQDLRDLVVSKPNFTALGTASTADIVDNLISTSATDVLSANQGKVLDTQHIALMETWAGSERNPIIYDDFGDANNMVMIPKFRVGDIDASLGTGVHPAFIVNGAEKDAIYIGKYQASAKGSNYVSVPNADPAVSKNFDQALAACAAKGDGWHLMTNAEWSAVALWSWKNGTTPRGNNNYGRDITYKNETGRLTDAAAVLGSSGTARTATGSGPATWSHDHTPDGIFDLNGNVWEWQRGMRLVDGEIQVIADNNAADNTISHAAGSSAWRAILQDGSLVAPGTANTLKWDSVSGVQLATSVTTSGTPSTLYKDVVAAGGVTIPAILRQLGLHPHATDMTRGRLYVNNAGERLPRRGGSWSNGATAGSFALYLTDERSGVNSSVGFRPAFVL